jgi:hypothetical protein
MSRRSLDACLFADDGIGRLSAQARRLMKLQHVLEQALPPALVPLGRVANLKPGLLVIHAQNGAVAAKIRQLLPRLAESFRNEGVDLNEIRVKVQPLDHVFTAVARGTQSELGEKPKQGLTSLAEKLPESSPLKAALTRLITRSGKAGTPAS